MIRLVLSEWLRFRSRRLVRVLALLAAAGVVIAVGIAFVQSDPPTDEQIARADRRAERMVERCIRQDGFGSIPDATDFEVERVNDGRAHAWCRRCSSPRRRASSKPSSTSTANGCHRYRSCP